MALSVLLGALAMAFGIALMATAGYLISRAAERPPILSLTVTIVAVRFLGLARPLTRYVDRLVGHDLALRSLARIRAAFYRRIEPLAPAQLQGYRRGDLLERMVRDVDALQGLYLRGLGPPLVALAVGAACVGVTAAFLPLAAVVLAAGLVLAGVVAPPLSHALSSAAAERQSALRGDLTAELVELLRGAPELAAYGREDETLARIRALDGELARLGRRDALVSGLGDALTVLVAGLTVVGVLAVAVSAHDADALDRVLVGMLALLALSSFDAVLPLPAAGRELAQSLASGARVLELTDGAPLVRDPSEPLPAPPRPAVVALEGVTARYAPGEPAALRGLDLRLEPGRRVALVGPSGAGKTTVTNLLFRFLDPEAGRVTIDGRDLRDYRQTDVRRTFALAGQEAHVFDSSIRENLRLARPAASDAELEDVVRQAQLSEWVSTLPDGLDTFVGEEGSRLSGGQRQRLVLARALLADAPVLVLDEPTAHLDPQTATSLMDDVLDAAGDRAVLLITHRAEGARPHGRRRAARPRPLSRPACRRARHGVACAQMRRTFSAAALAVVLVLLAAACGSSDDGSDTSATATWADEVCSSVTTWTDSLTASVSSLQGGNISRESLEGAADDVKSSTETLVDDLRALGKPDTEAGEQAKDSVDQLADQLEQEVEKIEGAVDDVSGASDVLTAISTVTSTLASMGSQLSSTFSELEQLDAAGELEDAFRESDSCQSITDDQP